MAVHCPLMQLQVPGEQTQLSVTADNMKPWVQPADGWSISNRLQQQAQGSGIVSRVIRAQESLSSSRVLGMAGQHGTSRASKCSLFHSSSSSSSSSRRCSFSSSSRVHGACSAGSTQLAPSKFGRL
jgi:hypothetical protein